MGVGCGKSKSETESKPVKKADNKSLYERLGGEAAVSAAVDQFYKKMVVDPRIKGFFKWVDMERLHKMQKAFLTKAFGGPDHYTGAPVKQSHMNLKITNFHFDAGKENLINTLKELNIDQDLIKEVADVFESARSATVDPTL